MHDLNMEEEKVYEMMFVRMLNMEEDSEEVITYA